MIRELSEAMKGQIVEVVPGMLFAFVNPYELDGRASSHPLSVRGYSTLNCYLLRAESHAVLYSTGYGIHQNAILEQLGEVLGDRTLTLALPRIEFPAMCNARAIAERFDVDVCYLRLPAQPADFLNFRSIYDIEDPGKLRDVGLGQIKTTAPITVQEGEPRELRFMVPHLRLLPGNWGFDDGTGTLFTGDMFSWGWRDSPEGPWLIDDAADDPTDPARVEDFLLNNRYWWLAGADTESFREGVKEVFERYSVKAIAPDHGAVLMGSAIPMHLSLLDEVLEHVAQLPSNGVTVGQRSVLT
jgi:hypothetical protein